MSRSDRILARVTRALDRSRRAIDMYPDLNQVVLCLKFDKQDKIRAIQLNMASEQEIKEEEDAA